MKIVTLPAAELPPGHLETWATVQQADPTLDSPFFRPEFTRAVAAVRKDVWVALLEEGGGPVGFFPFQRGRFGAGRPVGGPLSDFHGVVAPPDRVWDACDLVRGCRLSIWDFDHLLTSQAPFGPHIRQTAISPYMDLSGGFEAYAEERRQAGSDIVPTTLRKWRKLDREVGSVRLETHTTDPRCFDTLLAWKSAQYLRTGLTDVFGVGWTVRLLRDLLGYTGEPFAGMFSALYAGERLVAVHYGMRSGRVLHSWFPAYDQSLGKYSPGLVLLLLLAQAAEGVGIRRIDLGKGEEKYKVSLKSGAVPVGEGRVIPSRLMRGAVACWTVADRWARQSPAGGLVRGLASWTRPLRSWLRFQ